MKAALAIFLTLAVLWALPAHAIRVVCATNDLAAIANAVGGDQLEIEVVARPDRDPHTIEVRPSTMRKTAKADLYLSVGLSLDLWSQDIVRGSRNRDLVYLDCSTVITPLEVPTGKVDASMGDVHPNGNPHYWLDPLNAIAVAHFLAEHFSVIDESNRSTYERNADEFASMINERMKDWRVALQGKSFIEYHRTWVYLAQRFGMTIVGEVEPLPGIPATARHLAELSETIRGSDVTMVVRDYYHPESPMEFLERETGVKGVLLPSACAEPTRASYFEHLDTIARVFGGNEEKRVEGGSR